MSNAGTKEKLTNCLQFLEPPREVIEFSINFVERRVRLRPFGSNPHQRNDLMYIQTSVGTRQSLRVQTVQKRLKLFARACKRIYAKTMRMTFYLLSVPAKLPVLNQVLFCGASSFTGRPR